MDNEALSVDLAQVARGQLGAAGQRMRSRARVRPRW